MNQNLRKNAFLVAFSLLTLQISAQVYIDYRIRTNDFYAYYEFMEDDGTQPDPTWHFRFAVGDLSAPAWSDYECLNITDSSVEDWVGGTWSDQPIEAKWNGTCLNDDNLAIIELEGWEEEYGSDCSYDADSSPADQFYGQKGTLLRLNFPTRNNWESIEISCGNLNLPSYKKIQIENWWNYTLPLIHTLLNNATTNSFDITATHTNYRLTKWNYQVSTDEAFSIISASGTIAESNTSSESGTTTETTISLTGLNPSTTYYVRIEGINEAGTVDWTSPKSIATEANPTTWNGSSWDNGAPTSDFNAIINGDYGESDPIECKDLNINEGFKLNLKSENKLTVNRDLTVKGTLTIENGASLITLGHIYNNGTIRIEKTVAKDNQWHFIAIPNNTTTANTFFGDYLIPWNEQNASWENITNEEEVLIPVKGYSLKVIENSGYYTFTGTPNTGNQSISITYTDVAGDGIVEGGHDGANLIGNPYPSSIDWADLDNTYGAVYFWTGTQYANWNDGYSVNGATQYIAPMQGFFIITSSSGTFSLANENRTHSGADGFYKSTEPSLINGIVLFASNNSNTDELYIVFDQSCSSNFELQHDAYKLLSTTSGLSQLYSFNQDTKFSIDVRPQEATIQLGFQNNQDGVYSIGIKELNGLSGAFIEDTKTNTFFNLQNGNYQFEWQTSDNEKRFKFHLSATAIDQLDQKLASVFAFRKTLYIQSLEDFKHASVQIIDLSGKQVFQQQIDQANSTIPLNLANGMYTVLLTTEKGNQIQKIMLNQ